jgi:uncharacterized protein
MEEFIKTSLLEFWTLIGDMSPYLLFGFLVAGLLSVLISPESVENHLGGKGIWPIIKASLFGVPLPLCSCGVIPVAMGLRKHKASKGATISFLLSTPQTGVDSILVTYSLLGPVFAIFRPVIAFITGLIGGMCIDTLDDSTGQLKEHEQCKDQCCDETATKKHPVKRILNFGFITLPADIGKAMLLGLVIAAFLSAIIPADFFADKLGAGILSMIIMMALGIPVYVCATASVPIAAVLIAKGVSPGAALVFLMTGPATNAVAFMTIWKALGSKVAIIYIITVAVCAIGSGLLLDYVFTFEFAAQIKDAPHFMLPKIFKDISAVALLTILIWPIILKFKKP